MGRASLFCALALLACDTEPVDTGVFVQTACAGEGLACAGGYAYQLHIGRYGDAVTGIVVRYAYSGPGFNFAKADECGCFIIRTGVTDGDALSLQLFLPGQPGKPDPEFTNTAVGCGEPIPGDCSERTFELDGTDEGLAGSTSCRDGQPQSIEFERVQGRPRTTCIVP